MKTLDLSTYNTTDLTKEETYSISGGNPWAAWAATFLVFQIVTNPRAHIDAFMKGFNEGFNALDVTHK